MSNGGATKPSEKPFKVNVKVVCAKTLKILNRYLPFTTQR